MLGVQGNLVDSDFPATSRLGGIFVGGGGDYQTALLGEGMHGMLQGLFGAAIRLDEILGNALLAGKQCIESVLDLVGITSRQGDTFLHRVPGCR